MGVQGVPGVSIMSGVSTPRIWGRCWCSILLTRTPYGIGTVGLRVCDFAMCVEKRSKTLKDAADVEDWMADFVSNTRGFLSHMRVVLLRFQSDLILRLLLIINV